MVDLRFMEERRKESDCGASDKVDRVVSFADAGEVDVVTAVIWSRGRRDLEG